jgi:hypothetical protein
LKLKFRKLCLLADVRLRPVNLMIRTPKNLTAADEKKILSIFALTVDPSACFLLVEGRGLFCLMVFLFNSCWNFFSVSV